MTGSIQAIWLVGIFGILLTAFIAVFRTKRDGSSTSEVEYRALQEKEITSCEIRIGYMNANRFIPRSVCVTAPNLCIDYVKQQAELDAKYGHGSRIPSHS